MVLEQIYPLRLIEKHIGFSFLLGIVYSVVGIFTALLLFPEDPAIVAVAFTAILIIPTVSKLFKQAEEIESKKNEIHLKGFFTDHIHIFAIYTCLFLGIFLVFAFFAMMLPSLAANQLFENQLAVRYGNSGDAIHTGNAIINTSTFKTILFNNLSVLFVILLTAFLFGDGAFFVITWNASVWGTIFGMLAKGSALAVGKSIPIYFALIFVSVFPHMILEAMSYFSSAAAGGIISKGIVNEQFASPKFYHIFRDFVLLILLSIGILFAAAYLETYVLHNFEVYRIIIQQSFG